MPDHVKRSQAVVVCFTKLSAAVSLLNRVWFQLFVRTFSTIHANSVAPSLTDVVACNRGLDSFDSFTNNKTQLLLAMARRDHDNGWHSPTP